MLGPALIQGGLSVIGGILGSRSAKKAAREQAKAQMAAIAEQQRQYDLARQDLSPYRQAGAAATTQFNRLLGLSGAPPDFSEFLDSPDYQFALQQGQQALERSAAARGGLFSGNTGTALTEFGQGMAAQQLGNYTNRLMQLMGLGQSAAAGTAQAGLQTGQGVADSLVGAGDARASGIIGASNAWTNALGQLGGVAADAFSNRSSGVGRSNPNRLGGMAPIEVPMTDVRLDPSLVRMPKVRF